MDHSTHRSSEERGKYHFINSLPESSPERQLFKLAVKANATKFQWRKRPKRSRTALQRMTTAEGSPPEYVLTMSSVDLSGNTWYQMIQMPLGGSFSDPFLTFPSALASATVGELLHHSKQATFTLVQRLMML